MTVSVVGVTSPGGGRGTPTTLPSEAVQPGSKRLASDQRASSVTWLGVWSVALAAPSGRTVPGSPLTECLLSAADQGAMAG